MHDFYMRRALSLASRGLGKTSPNPLVGCVIVKDNRIIGEGWHHEYGHSHAEIEAINDAVSRNEDIKGSTFYVTLEPCSHYGKTPPCADRLVKEGVSEVIIAMTDPNPKVNGRGIKILRDSGIKVTELGGEINEAAKILNRGFIFVHKYGRPFVTVKAAMSLDGKMCLNNGSSKWLTGIEARTEAHKIRAENDAVLVGVNTVLNDDPELTVRHVEGVNPSRIILDTNLRTPENAKVIGNDGKCIILSSVFEDVHHAEKLRKAGAEIINLPISENGHINLHEAVKFLALRGILTLMVEGGAEVISSFIREGLADYAKLFMSPRILGEGKGFDINMNFENVNEAFRLKGVKSKMLGEDIMTEGRFTCSPDL